MSSDPSADAGAPAERPNVPILPLAERVAAEARRVAELEAENAALRARLADPERGRGPE